MRERAWDTTLAVQVPGLVPRALEGCTATEQASSRLPGTGQLASLHLRCFVLLALHRDLAFTLDEAIGIYGHVFLYHVHQIQRDVAECEVWVRLTQWGELVDASPGEDPANNHGVRDATWPVWPLCDKLWWHYPELPTEVSPVPAECSCGCRGQA